MSMKEKHQYAFLFFEKLFLFVLTALAAVVASGVTHQIAVGWFIAGLILLLLALLVCAKFMHKFLKHIGEDP